MPDAKQEVLIIGAGAAGMMAALAARRALAPDGRALPVPPGAPCVLLVDGAERVGRKILISGGGRCNVTNEQVSEADFASDAPHLVRGLLRAFPVGSVRTFFESRGCPLHAEPLGKLFPQSNRAQDVLGVLLAALAEAGAVLETGCEIARLERDGAGFRAATAAGRVFDAETVIVATGGKSVPKTGSRGFGLVAAAELGHELEPPLPALTPIWVASDSPIHGLAGVTVPALLSLVPADCTPEQVSGARLKPIARAAGSFLITHRGASGPAALDVSGACALALTRAERVELRADFWTLGGEGSPFHAYTKLPKPPGASLASELVPRPTALPAFAQEMKATGGATFVAAAQARVPKRLAEALLGAQRVPLDRRLMEASQDEWHRAWLALVHCDLKLSQTDGFDKAEVTTGGVRLCELDRMTLASKRHAGLHFCGEVVNVTGRLGGFNFQWAWSSGYVAGRATAVKSV